MKALRLPCSALSFADLAERYAQVCRARSWRTPGFKTLTADHPHNRSLSRQGDGAVVGVKTSGREYEDVLNDLAAGVLRANELEASPEAVYRLSMAALNIIPPRSLPARDLGADKEEPF